MVGEKRRRESVGSVDAYRRYLENGKEAQRQTQDTQGLDKKCREILLLLSRLIKGFRKNYH